MREKNFMEIPITFVHYLQTKCIENAFGYNKIFIHKAISHFIVSVRIA